MADLSVSSSDSLTTADQLTSYYVDQIDIQEAVTVAVFNGVAVSDSITLTENTSVTIAAVTPDAITVSDSSALSDSPSYYTDFIIVNDRLLIVATPPDLPVNKSDTSTLTESVTGFPYYPLLTQDTSTSSELVDIIRNNSRDIIIIDSRITDQTGAYITDETGQFISDQNPDELSYLSENLALLVAIPFFELVHVTMTQPSPLSFTLIIPEDFNLKVVVE